MTQVGVIHIEELSYGEVMKQIKVFLEKHGPQYADSSKEISSWYQSNQEGNGRLNIEKYFTFDFWTRKKTERVDPLTKEVKENIDSQNRRICVTSNKENDANYNVYVIAEKGSANAITDIFKALNIHVTIRKKISFDEDFIEYLNTAEPKDRRYNEIFNGDMESTSRRARRGKHRIDERYLDPSMREAQIQEQFREAAGVRITPRVELAKLLPTMEVILYNNGWLNLARPKREDDEVIYYEAILYGVSRLSEAYDKFRAH